jgi:hypothetical protein
MRFHSPEEVVNRSDCQKLALARIADAKALLAAKRWSGAYYLSGYGVECGLKACVLVRLAAAPEVMFEDRKYSDKCWTHSLVQLVDSAGLRAALAAACSADSKLFDYWNVVKDWKESSRYVRTAKLTALQMYKAITHKRHGVLSWIKARW